MPDSDTDSDSNLDCKLKGYIVLFRTLHITWRQCQIPIPTTEYRIGTGIGIGICSQSTAGSHVQKSDAKAKSSTNWSLTISLIIAFSGKLERIFGYSRFHNLSTRIIHNINSYRKQHFSLNKSWNIVMVHLNLHQV